MMIDDESSAVASLPPWLQDFVRQLTPSTPSQSSVADAKSLAIIRTPDELEAYVWATFGVRIPKVRVCPDHQSPWEAFCAGYFATSASSVIVIKGSRGLAGKSWLIALLGTVIATTLRADVTILGGSSTQSNRVHRAMAKFWAAPNAPRQLLKTEPGVTRTEFIDGHTIEALTASQKSARGAHPLALLIDEVDELDLKLFDAAMGQTMDMHGYTGRTIISSTHQHADGTMTAVLKRAQERSHWQKFEWCWKETLEPHGWLTTQQVNRKRGEMTAEMWRIEVDLGEPSIEGRAIFTEKVERMFLGESIMGDGAEFPYTEFEPPLVGAVHATGADWARTRDYVEIVTFRIDVHPMRLVAYQRFTRRPTQYIEAAFNHQLSRYPGEALHDASSLGGKIMNDLIGTDEWSQGVSVTGFDFGRHRERAQMFTDYIIAIEAEEIVSPRIALLYQQHKFVTNEDLRPGGTGHPPDGFVAGAMAYKASNHVARPLELMRGRPRSRPEATRDNGNGYDIHPPTIDSPLTGLSRAFGFVSSKDGNGNGHNGNGGSA